MDDDIDLYSKGDGGVCHACGSEESCDTCNGCLGCEEAERPCEICGVCAECCSPMISVEDIDGKERRVGAPCIPKLSKFFPGGL